MSMLDKCLLWYQRVTAGEYSALLLKQIRDLAVIKRNGSLKQMTLKSFIIDNNQLFHSHKSSKKNEDISDDCEKVVLSKTTAMAHLSDLQDFALGQENSELLEMYY